MQAKLIRAILRESFPSVRFSVRSHSYSMGASVYVNWTDGPTERCVSELLSPLNGRYFDAMIDYSGSRYASLDGEPVSFAANASCTRERGPLCEAMAKAWQELSHDERHRLRYKLDLSARYDNDDMARELWRSWSPGHDPKPSVTLARIKFIGDDGYGQGTVGTPDKPMTMQGYADFEREACAK